MAARTWIAVVLCLFVWVGYLKWFAPPIPEKQPSVVEQQAEPRSSSGHITQNNQKLANMPSSGNGAVSKVDLLSDFPAPQKEELYEVKDSETRVVFSSIGGKISRYELLDYGTSVKPDAPPISLVGETESSLSLAGLFTHEDLSALGRAKFDLVKSENEIRFEARGSEKVRFIKKYKKLDKPYVWEATYELIQEADGSEKNYGYFVIPIGIANPKYDFNSPLHAWEVAYTQNDKLGRVPTEKLTEKDEILQGATQWLSFGNRYFATVVVNHSDLNPDVVLHRDSNFSGGYLRFPVVFKPGEGVCKFRFEFYIGPKDLKLLSGVSGLSGLVDYGMFSFLAHPLLFVLNFFYRFFANYGVAIILLTLLVRALFYPLSQKGMKSMKEMQKIQPQIAALKEKFKDDKERFNREQLALLKTHKVNPMGGCLPLLVQLPVFFALYSVLGNSIELFHSPFFGWVKDLSAKDPFYVLPILMGITMFFQQKMTPAAGMDPMQQKMMLLMPVVFSFFMLNLPSGLTLYIFVSTLLGILQQIASTRETKIISKEVQVKSS